MMKIYIHITYTYATCYIILLHTLLQELLHVFVIYVTNVYGLLKVHICYYYYMAIVTYMLHVKKAIWAKAAHMRRYEALWKQRRSGMALQHSSACYGGAAHIWQQALLGRERTRN